MESEDLAKVESHAAEPGLDSDACRINLRGGDDAVESCRILLLNDDVVVVESGSIPLRDDDGVESWLCFP